jgi:hypothetical protein
MENGSGDHDRVGSAWVRYENVALGEYKSFADIVAFYLDEMLCAWFGAVSVEEGVFTQRCCLYIRFRWRARRSINHWRSVLGLGMPEHCIAEMEFTSLDDDTLELEREREAAIVSHSESRFGTCSELGPRPHIRVHRMYDVKG